MADDKKKAAAQAVAALRTARSALVNANRGKTTPGHDERNAAITKIDAALGVRSK